VADVREVLAKHRGRLAQEAEVLSENLTAVDELIEKGVDVPAVKGNRIVMINIAVTELDPCRRFYEEALGVEFAEEAHGDGPVHLNATFGEWNTHSWFLVSLWPSPELAGTVNIGFLVEDLDATYERALEAGATDDTHRWISRACLASRRFETRAGITSASIRG
jgi:predicted enzyme related to lactoylglutathione lyase